MEDFTMSKLEMKSNKKGMVNIDQWIDVLIGFIIAIIMVIILIIVAVALFPLYISACNDFANTGYPLTSLFDPDLGVVVLIYVAVVLLVIVVALFALLRGMMTKTGKGKR